MDRFSVGDWKIETELKESGILHLSVYCPDGRLFCAESVQAHLHSEKLQFLVAAFESSNHACALSDVQHVDARVS